jgi:threonine dehydratase
LSAEPPAAAFVDDDALLGVPLLVLANKQDAPDAISASEIEGLMHLGSIRDRTWRCLACSALRGRGLVDGLRWLAETHVGEHSGIIGGASGVAGLGVLLAAAEDPALAKQLQLDAHSRVALVVCEGAVEPELFEKLVGTSAETLRRGGALE